VGFRAVTIAFAVLAASVLPALAQTQVVVQGRVFERGTATPVVGATVELDGQPSTTTSSTGAFRIEGVTPGGYSLRVEALGYSPSDVFLVIRQDTSLVVELDVAPVALDTLAVDAREIDLRGHVKERGSDLSLVRTEVHTNLNRETRTNTAGRFRLRDLPAGFPILIQIRAFGYYPLDSTVVAEQDTTLTFELVVDSLAQRMIDVEVARLEERARPFRSAIMPAITREQLLRSRGTVLDVLQSRYSINLGRVQCIVIDERQRYNGLDEFALILPEEVERIEVLERGAMLRVYTRDFIKTMLGGGIRLRRPVYIGQTRPPTCY
jgi:hypothetical protein